MLEQKKSDDNMIKALPEMQQVLIEKQLDIPVYATISRRKNQKLPNKELRKPQESIQKDKQLVLSLRCNEEVVIESLRSLRTTVHFSLLDSHNISS